MQSWLAEVSSFHTVEFLLNLWLADTQKAVEMTNELGEQEIGCGWRELSLEMESWSHFCNLFFSVFLLFILWWLQLSAWETHAEGTESNSLSSFPPALMCLLYTATVHLAVVERLHTYIKIICKMSIESVFFFNVQLSFLLNLGSFLHSNPKRAKEISKKT